MSSHVLQAVFKVQDKRDVAINILLCIYICIYNYVLYFSVAQSCPSLCDPMDCRTPGFPVLHYLSELAQTLVHWVSDAIQLSSSVIPFSSFNLSQHHGLFQWIGSLHKVAKGLELQLQHQSFQWRFRTDFLQDWLVWSSCSPRDPQEFSPTPQFKSINSWALSFLYGPTFTSIHDYWKNHSLTRRTFVGKVMPLLFNMLSRFVIAFLPRSKHLLFSWLESPSTVILSLRKLSLSLFPLFLHLYSSPSSLIVSPLHCHEVMGPDAMILVLWMLSFKSAFSLSSFTFIKKLFS